MVKKVIVLIFSVCLVLSICVKAETTNTENVQSIPAQSQRMPEGERIGRGDFPEDMAPPSERMFDDEIPMPDGGIFQEGQGGIPVSMQNNNNTVAEKETGFLGFIKTYSTPITSVFLLILAFIFVIFYKRKNY